MVEKTEKMNAFQAARVAGCGEPDSNDSKGAEWLRECVRRGRNLADEYGLNDPHGQGYEAYEEDATYDAIHEAADSAVPIYTYNLWMIWVELQGYAYDNELSNDLHLDKNELEKLPQYDLYDIAQKIIEANVTYKGE